MKKIHFTITGMTHHYGKDFFEPAMKEHLVKAPDNEFDKEAIRSELEGFGQEAM